jgi:hypothetical protein
MRKMGRFKKEEKKASFAKKNGELTLIPAFVMVSLSLPV